jgi:hypothetical protein
VGKTEAVGKAEAVGITGACSNLEPQFFLGFAFDRLEALILPVVATSI